VIGIVIQSAYILAVMLRGTLFTDKARSVIKDYVIAALDDIYRNGAQRPLYADQLGRSGADSSFVWLYYVNAPAHLIDWARRRRSYHYLGVNWGIAAIVGMVLGLGYPAVIGATGYAHPRSPLTVFGVLAATAFWVAAAWYFAYQMKRDVDDMELFWSHWRITPALRAAINETPQTQAPSAAQTSITPGTPA
jgi:hypothetical protein